MREGALHFELNAGRIFTEVRVNGRGPYHIVFDTAANAVISQHLSQELKISPPAVVAGTPTGQADGQAAPAATLDSVQLGGLKLQNVAAEVAPDDQLPAIGSLHADAVLGMAALQQAVVKVDYERHEISFIPFEKFIYTGNGTVLACDMTGTSPSIFASVNGSPGSFIVSTGSGAALSLDPEFVRGGQGAEYAWESGGENPAPELAALADAKSVRLMLGGLKLRDVPVEVASGVVAKDLPANDGVLGGALLQQFTVYFDAQHKQIILEPNRNFGRPTQTSLRAAEKQPAQAAGKSSTRKKAARSASPSPQAKLN